MLLAIAATILFFATSAHAEEVLRYSDVFFGKTNGTQTTTVDEDGHIVVDYSYRNNGRGPDLREETVIAADGTHVSYSALGKSTFGSPIPGNVPARGRTRIVANACRTRRDRHFEPISEPFAERGTGTFCSADSAK